MNRVRCASVDGVRTLFLPEGSPGPLNVALVFGVGRCDESLINSGITHVVEHLVLQSIGPTPYIWNGEVRPTSTRFLAVGSTDEVVGFLHHLCRSIEELPTDRLEHELQILEVEGRQHGSNRVGEDLSVRFGPRGAGLMGWPDLGRKNASAVSVLDWARRWFTAENAVLTISGPIPPALSLKGLPSGQPPERSAPPDAQVAERVLVTGKTNLVSVSMISNQEFGVAPAMVIAIERGVQSLRLQEGISYSIAGGQTRIGGGASLQQLFADTAEGAASKVFSGLVNIIENLSRTGPTDEELHRYRSMYQQMKDHPQAVLENLDSDAERMLLGLPAISEDELRTRLEALTSSSIAEEISALKPSLLGIGPEELAESQDGWVQHKVWTEESIQGHSYLPIGGREKGTLTLGSDGVTWALDENHRVTVLWSEAVAVLTWDDGARKVIGPSGASVLIVPWCWQSATDTSLLVDVAVPADRRVRIDAEIRKREPDTNPYWLCSIAGAVYRMRYADIAVSTSGLLVLPRWQRLGKASMPDRLHDLKWLSVETLLASNKHGRMINADTIEHVRLRRRLIVGSLKAGVTIRTCDGSKCKFLLRTDKQINMLGSSLERLLGPRLQWRK